MAQAQRYYNNTQRIAEAIKADSENTDVKPNMEVFFPQPNQQETQQPTPQQAPQTEQYAYTDPNTGIPMVGERTVQENAQQNTAQPATQPTQTQQSTQQTARQPSL